LPTECLVGYPRYHPTIFWLDQPLEAWKPNKGSPENKRLIGIFVEQDL